MKRSREERCRRPPPHTNGMEDGLFYDCIYPSTGNVFPVELDDEWISAKLQELEREIDKLSMKSKEAYMYALEEEVKQHIEYVRSEKLLLKFLRSVNFDASKAALRLVKFLRCKRDLFGPDLLIHRIRQEHFNDDDRTVIESGYSNFFGTDCGGRLIFFTQRCILRQRGLLNEHYMQSIMRVGFYQIMCAIEEAENDPQNYPIYKRNSQKPVEVVLIRWGLNGAIPLKDFRLIFLMAYKDFFSSMPFKVVAIHSCCGSPMERMCVSWMESLSKKHSEHLLEMHGPSPAQCFAELSKYGIDVDFLPVTESGEFNAKAHEKRMEQLRQLEFKVKAESCLSHGYSEGNDDKQFFFNEMEGETEIYSDYELQIPALMRDPLGEFASAPKDVVNMNMDMYLMESTPSSDPLTTKSDEMELSLSGLKSHASSSSSSSFPDNTSSDGEKEKVCSTRMKEEDLPAKILALLTNKTDPDAIWWSRGGTAFVINKQVFSKSVLPTEFNGIKFASFLRKLSRCGYQRLPVKGQLNSDYTEYLFKRDKSADQLKKEEDRPMKSDRRLPFKLMNAIDDNSAKNAIWWVSNGQAFAIDTNKFASDGVLERYFEGVQLSSFIRMLRKWGFKRFYDHGEEVDKTKSTLFFQHNLFTQEELLQLRNSLDSSSSAFKKDPLRDWTYSDTLDEVRMTDEKFPMKLYKALSGTTTAIGTSTSDCNTSQALWWLDSGTAFALNKKKLETEQVLTKKFNRVKLQSFLRSLTRWGFEKMSSNGGLGRGVAVYQHPLFRKNSPHLLNQWSYNESKKPSKS